MADVQAGQQDTQQQQQQPPQDPPEKKEGDETAPRTYTQAELDRIAAKIRKNARREARIEAERDFYARQAQPKEEKKDPPKEEAAPEREKFDSYEDFQVALSEHTARKVAREETKKATEEREKQAREKSEKETAEKAAKAWHGKIEATMAKLADFEDVLEDNHETLELIGGAPMKAFITESDLGPQIIYELCKSPAEAKRIAALPAYKQAAEIAKIEEKLAAAAKPKDKKEGEEDDEDATREASERNPDGTFKPKKEPSKAPEPIEPVGERAANTSNLPSDKDDPETWRRKELARMKRQQGKL